MGKGLLKLTYTLMYNFLRPFLRFSTHCVENLRKGNLNHSQNKFSTQCVENLQMKKFTQHVNFLKA